MQIRSVMVILLYIFDLRGGGGVGGGVLGVVLVVSKVVEMYGAMINLDFLFDHFVHAQFTACMHNFVARSLGGGCFD